MTIRLSNEALDKLRRAAREVGLTVSAAARALVEDHQDQFAIELGESTKDGE